MEVIIVFTDMNLYIRLLHESLKFALNALRTNKLRTLLSLLGVTVGIFSIIAVLAAVDSLDKKIKSDLSDLDKNTIYLMKYCFGPSEVPDWKIDQFPNVTYDEYEMIKRTQAGLDKISFNVFTKAESLRYESKVASAVSITPCSDQFVDLDALKVEQGRFFNESESNAGAAVIVLGNSVAETLFDQSNPLGKKIRMYGRRFTVIGVLKKAGSVSIGSNTDKNVFIPVNFVRILYGDNNKQLTPAIVLKPLKSYDVDLFKAELTQKIRAFRGLKPGAEDNFFVNIFAGFMDMIDEVVGKLNLMGWVISGFSLLVGGFGIANIMFVSVKERTNLIGIQKSLGAKNRFILFQFLFEAVILSLIGGVVGLLLVWLMAFIATAAFDFEFVLSMKNILLGSGISCLIGLIAGVIPAISASKLDPVEAIRSGM